MRTYFDLSEVQGDLGPSAVTIGKFDGVHAGHRAVIGELLRVAEEKDLRSIVITFDRHPLAQLDPAARPHALVSNAQRLELLAGTGVDVTLFLSFDEALASMTPREFATRVLRDVCGTRVVMVGEDFRFGAKGEGDIHMLRALGAELGFEVDLIPEVRPGEARKVSSSWIRELLADGDVERAGEMLGRTPSVRGEVVHGAARGRELGYPTANLSPESEGLIPADGVYAGWLTDGEKRYPAAISVGSNPTFTGVPPKQVEAYVLDEELDLYGHIVDISFVARIRGQVRFAGIEPLIAQMDDDVAGVRSILAGR
ncbi:bifunctional riboflavin kinase/FAD synthetase [Herbiconiux sp. CPCC 203407]|uniref:Riboflavin biosynthesis protein n=1 Tax=Herbiconiux oxytropis TaxID=2970915 RepID=A0AA41XGQ7_9MICO|nr:bifunctional riboflavin kinase/FAD synthetase [Herbiconiux oxytropis]MCS5720575.1 bifunctional riboflavin kinase/FAD synthetase [Herbiconiux oxytropis]MCS5726148.1 bifunctional riboflavin kinase/FAD synthetase [Herbiconiux oxytropis]